MNRLLSISLLGATLLFFCGSTRAEWHRFRGPDGNGYISGSKELPPELGENTLAWKATLPGRGLGSPIVIGDRVIVSAASGPHQDKLQILCFSNQDGSELWRRSFWATGRTMCHKKTCVAAPTPTTDGKHIYALWSSNDLISVDLEGNLRWMRGLTLDYPNASNSLGMSSSPLIAGNTLVAQIENDSESFAAGFDLDSGANKWKIARPKMANWTSPVTMKFGGQTIVALQSGKGVMGVAPSTGSELWNFSKGASTIPSGAAAGDTLIVPSRGLTAFRPNAKGGEPVSLWNQKTQKPATASPLVTGDRFYFVNSAGVLTAADRKTGDRLWRIRLKGPFSGSPVACQNGHLYLFNEEGLGQVVRLSGDEGEVVSEFELGETILATPSIAQDSLYIRSDQTLWKFAKKGN
jgi:outer membrane protein assembly factor BamB